MVDDEYVTLELKPRRSRRFLQLVAKHALMHKLKKAHEYRSKFLEKIDKLRNVESMTELKKVERVTPKAPKSSEYIESQIKRMLEIEEFLENEVSFNRQILSRLSENDVSQLTLLKKILEKERVDDSKIGLLDEKIKQIDQLKKSVQRLRQSIEKMIVDEQSALAREKTSGRKLDKISAKFEEEEKLLREEMQEIKAMRERLDAVSGNMIQQKKASARMKRPVKKAVKKQTPAKKPKKVSIKKPTKTKKKKK
ncbi:hypothetical protein KY335_02580 [Candidatus Woesearchaeota archaeon]|nr:hypothetical protein [Candidatus Woesearchaeota archaeon]